MRRKYKHKAPAKARRLRQSSFFYRGPQLWSLLQERLRQFEEIIEPTKDHEEKFDIKLDEYLAHISDEPTIPGLFRKAETNSLVHQIPLRDRKRRNETGKCCRYRYII